MSAWDIELSGRSILIKTALGSIAASVSGSVIVTVILTVAPNLNVLIFIPP